MLAISDVNASFSDAADELSFIVAIVCSGVAPTAERDGDAKSNVEDERRSEAPLSFRPLAASTLLWFADEYGEPKSLVSGIKCARLLFTLTAGPGCDGMSLQRINSTITELFTSGPKFIPSQTESISCQPRSP